MLESLKTILDIQELDVKMIRLLRLKKLRTKELEQINSIRDELYQQLQLKEAEISDLSKKISQLEEKAQEITDRLKKLETRQSSVKKVDEFNALTQEITSTEKEKIAIEHQLSDLLDKKIAEDELLEKIKENLRNSENNTRSLEDEIQNNIKLINEEGKELLVQKEQLVKKANPELYAIYEKLLKNKKDRVIVPIEDRTCTGCHITLTPQHESLVRKGDVLVFCEHCSRIHYWQQEEVKEEEGATKRRRRRRIS